MLGEKRGVIAVFEQPASFSLQRGCFALGEMRGVSPFLSNQPVVFTKGVFCAG